MQETAFNAMEDFQENSYHNSTQKMLCSELTSTHVFLLLICYQ